MDEGFESAHLAHAARAISEVTTKPVFITEHPQVPPGVFSTVFYGVLGSADTSLCLLLTATNE